MEVLLFIVLAFSILVTFSLFIFYRQKYKKFISVIAQLIVDKTMVEKKLDAQTMLASKEVNDGFVKFLSESREAAFEYIEDVQKAIQNYLSAIDSNDSEKILLARMDLFSYLPDKTENENQDK